MTILTSASPLVPAGGNSAPLPSTELEVLLDFPELVRRCMGRVELAQRLLASFTKRFPEEISQIEECLRIGDAQRLKRLTHQFKGTAANVSAPALCTVATKMEDAARAEKYEVVADCIQEARHTFDRLQACRVLTDVGSGAPASDRG